MFSCPQYTEEKIGNAEKTELDRHFESLSLQADAARQWTEKLVTGAEAVLIPNPGESLVIEDIFGNHKVTLSWCELIKWPLVKHCPVGDFTADRMSHANNVCFILTCLCRWYKIINDSKSTSSLIIVDVLCILIL